MILSICLFMPDTLENDSDKIHIVATLFPQYDLATQVAGDKAVVKLLVEPGIETHTYEPTARDMMTIMNNTDIFLYTGLELEPWTENIVENLNNVEATDESEVENALIVNVAEKVDLIKQEVKANLSNSFTPKKNKVVALVSLLSLLLINVLIIASVFILMKVNKINKITIINVTHDMDEILYGDNLIVIDNGNIEAVFHLADVHTAPTAPGNLVEMQVGRRILSGRVR